MRVLAGVLLLAALVGCSSPSAGPDRPAPSGPASTGPAAPPVDSPLCADLRAVVREQASAPGGPVPRPAAEAASRVLQQTAGGSEGVLPDDVALGLRDVARLGPVDRERAAAVERFVQEQCPP